MMQQEVLLQRREIEAPRRRLDGGRIVPPLLGQPVQGTPQRFAVRKDVITHASGTLKIPVSSGQNRC